MAEELIVGRKGAPPVAVSSPDPVTVWVDVLVLVLVVGSGEGVSVVVVMIVVASSSSELEIVVVELAVELVATALGTPKTVSVHFKLGMPSKFTHSRHPGRHTPEYSNLRLNQANSSWHPTGIHQHHLHMSLRQGNTPHARP